MAGRRIDDHSAWMGSRGKDSVLPDGPHKVKTVGSAEGFGELSHYEDTNETIVSQQNMSKKKVQSHPHKSGTRY